MVAVPVLLGSLMRIPLGWLTDRLRRARGVHRADGVHAAAADRARASGTTRSPTMLVFGFLLGFTGASFAVGIPFVNGWYAARAPRLRARCLRHGHGRHDRSPGSPPRRIADRWGLSAPFWVAAALMAVMVAVFALLARDAAPSRPRRPAAEHARRPLGVPHQRPRVGADAVLLPRLRRLRRDVPLPAEAAHRRARPQQGRRRRARRRLRPAGRASDGRPAAGSPDRIGAARVLLVSFVGGRRASRSCSPPPTRRWCR